MVLRSSKDGGDDYGALCICLKSGWCNLISCFPFNIMKVPLIDDGCSIKPLQVFYYTANKPLRRAYRQLLGLRDTTVALRRVDSPLRGGSTAN